MSASELERAKRLLEEESKRIRTSVKSSLAELLLSKMFEGKVQPWNLANLIRDQRKETPYKEFLSLMKQSPLPKHEDITKIQLKDILDKEHLLTEIRKISSSYLLLNLINKMVETVTAVLEEEEKRSFGILGIAKADYMKLYERFAEVEKFANLDVMEPCLNLKPIKIN